MVKFKPRIAVGMVDGAIAADGESSSLGAVIERYPAPMRPCLANLVVVGGASAGFSGGTVWKGMSPNGPVALRRWPNGYPRQRIAAIHSLLAALQRDNAAFVRCPLKTTDQATMAIGRDAVFELSPWLPGNADRNQSPSAVRIASAARLLARFHCAAERCFVRAPMRWIGNHDEAQALLKKQPIPSSAFENRKCEWRRLRSLGGDSLPTASLPPLVFDLAQRTLSEARRQRAWIDRELGAAAPMVVPTICLRDVHREHVLFAADEATGLIDFGALGIDTAAADLGRYLGSAAPERPDLWHVAFAAYRTERALPAATESLAEWVDKTGAVIGALHWLEWLGLRRRSFSNESEALLRWQTLLQRIENWPTWP